MTTVYILNDKYEHIVLITQEQDAIIKYLEKNKGSYDLDVIQDTKSHGWTTIKTYIGVKLIDGQFYGM